MGSPVKNVIAIQPNATRNILPMGGLQNASVNFNKSSTAMPTVGHGVGSGDNVPPGNICIVLNLVPLPSVKTSPQKPRLLPRPSRPVGSYTAASIYGQQQARLNKKQMQQQQDADLSKPHLCDVCNKGFSRKSDLKRHSTTHSGERPYTCMQCDFKTSRKDFLKVHERKKHDSSFIKPVPCMACGKRFSLNSQLKIHMRVHTGEHPFACSQCTYTTTQKGNLKTHIRLKHPNFIPGPDLLPPDMESMDMSDKIHSCNICSKRFSRKSDLKRHAATHSGERPFGCNQCEFKTSRKDFLKVHQQTKHQEDFVKPIPCPTCGKRFSLNSQLKIHMRIHTGEHPFACHMCDYSTTQKGNLKTHMRLKHSTLPSDVMKAKPYQCSTCSKRFSNKASLKAHLVVHTGQWPYACTACDNKYKYAESLKRHERVNHSELLPEALKPFSCVTCNKRFYSASKLKIHSMAHSGERPYSCNQCEFKTAWKRSLTKHQHVKHNTHEAENHINHMVMPPGPMRDMGPSLRDLNPSLRDMNPAIQDNIMQPAIPSMRDLSLTSNMRDLTTNMRDMNPMRDHIMNTNTIPSMRGITSSLRDMSSCEALRVPIPHPQDYNRLFFHMNAMGPGLGPSMICKK